MDVGGGKGRKSERKGLGRESGASALANDALGPHAVAESEPEEPASPGQKDADDSDVALEAVDTDPEYALIPVEEEDEEEEDERPEARVAAASEQQGDDLGSSDHMEGTEAAASCPVEASHSAAEASPPQKSDAVETPADEHAVELAQDGTDADVTVVEASATASSRVQEREEEEEEEVAEEEAIELSLGLSDSSVEGPAAEAADERGEEGPAQAPAAESKEEADANVVAASDGASAVSALTPLRKRKRSKKTSYSTRPRSKLERRRLESAKPPPVDVTAEQSDHVHGKKRHLEHGKLAVTGTSPGQESTFLYPSTPTGTVWQWDSCEMYFAPISQENLDDLERIRKSQANFVAANTHHCRATEAQRAQMDAMMSDASDRSSSHVALDQRRGRYYRDTWEEEDFVAAARRKLDEEDDDLPPAVQSNHELVFGYDDDLFRDYIARLEAAVAATAVDVDKSKTATQEPQPETQSSQPQRTTTTRRASKQSSNSKRSKKAPRAPSPKQTAAAAHSPLEDILPILPCHQFHPASLGWWRLVKDRHVKEPSYLVVHPASVSRNSEPVRWIEEAEAYRKRVEEEEEEKAKAAERAGDFASDGSELTADHDGAEAETKAATSGSTNESAASRHSAPLKLPSFGDAGLEQDEISRVIASSVAKLGALSMVNWRTLQTVYERAACAQQCASIFDAEAAAKKSLEHLYTSMFAPSPDLSAGDASGTPTAVSTSNAVHGRDKRPVSLSTRPRDLIAFSSRPSMSGEDASDAVAASVEFGMSLQMGDVVDVLDRTGCWNDGVVLEVFAEGGRYPKFVLVRLALWSREVVEWVGVSEGRLLPRGVAAGTMEFVLSRSQFRPKKFSLTRAVADALERSFPQRRARLAAAAQREAQLHARLMQLEDGKAMQKRKRKRVSGAGAAV